MVGSGIGEHTVYRIRKSYSTVVHELWQVRLLDHMSHCQFSFPLCIQNRYPAWLDYVKMGTFFFARLVRNKNKQTIE